MVFLKSNFLASTHIPPIPRLGCLCGPHHPLTKGGSTPIIGVEDIRGTGVILSIYNAFPQFVVTILIPLNP
jgi:hypothetical protein